MYLDCGLNIYHCMFGCFRRRDLVVIFVCVRFNTIDVINQYSQVLTSKDGIVDLTFRYLLSSTLSIVLCTLLHYYSLFGETPVLLQLKVFFECIKTIYDLITHSFFHKYSFTLRKIRHLFQPILFSRLL